MAKLVDLKLDPAEQKEEIAETMPEKPRYPWWSRLNIDNDDLEKLGLSADLAIGTKLNLVGEARVTGTSKRQNEDGTDYECLDVQITRMALVEQKPRAEDVLYPEKGEGK